MDPKQAANEALAKYPKARRIPVENVAHWGNDARANAINLEQDRKCYGWKGDTYNAIRLALRLQNKI